MSRPIATVVLVLLSVQQTMASDELDFGREILPVLSDRCFQCHGPDEENRQADLRLDRNDSSADIRGIAAVVSPDRVDESELLKRLLTSDPDLRMPPDDSKVEPLSSSQIATIRRWIAAGAEWGGHWSLSRPSRPPLPASIPGDDVHPIDRLIRHRLAEVGLPHNDRASDVTRLRRVSFDLTGLPPSREEVEDFLRDTSDEAWQRAVERLLKSPHYGERMAMWWLDAARYSDTDGYQGDGTRTNWPWRDWVIQSFNANMPFDQFTIEQFAGDLLPNAADEQILATCFHRNHMTNGEGGRDPEESRIDYVIDRVNTMGTVWLGLTLGCAQCHSHKFDPISQRDYYSLFAFFDSIEEDGRAGGGAKPFLKYKSPFAERAVKQAQGVVDRRSQRLGKVRETAQHDFEGWLARTVMDVQHGYSPWTILRGSSNTSVEGTRLIQDDDGVIQASGPNPRQDDYRIVADVPASMTGKRLTRITGIRLEVFPHASHTDGKLSRGASGEFILTDVKLQVARKGKSQRRDVDISNAIADVEKNVGGRAYGKVGGTLDDDPRNGWTTETHDGRKPHVAVFALATPVKLQPTQQLVFVMLHRSTRGDANIGRFRVSVTDQPGNAVRSLEPMPLERLVAAKVTNPNDVDAALRKRLFEQFLTDHAMYQRRRRDVDRAQQQLSTMKRANGTLNVMVLAERGKPRTTHILERGVWNKKGDAVTRDVPSSILAWQGSDDRSRLDLARWLVSRDNPLTARVVVNHLWQLCFGSGLVRTTEDFGLQGERPTHPELLDWLAVELMEHNWDLQHILRLIVTSETYQQDSEISPDLLARDPDNRLFARATRFRLPSWMIRDAVLRSSGLLDVEVGGPPVMPYQPDGVWAEMFMGRYRYQPSQGSAQFRRTLYAFWRRSAAPTFLFDSSQRRVCEVRQRRTNTPLHALTLLNDVSIREAARNLALRATQLRSSMPERLTFLFQEVTSREPTERELSVLTRESQRALEYYAAEPDAATTFLDFGQPEQIERVLSAATTEVAAYTVVATLIYNLDEAITHE